MKVPLRKPSPNPYKEVPLALSRPLKQRNLWRKLTASHSFRCVTLIALTVWTTWLVATGPVQAFSNLLQNWEISVTMIFGSMVAGGTSMGGGAVAFPVLTKVLHIPSHEAKIFSLAIQSVGMGAAFLTIVATRIRVEWRIIRWASLGAIPGTALGAMVLAPHLPSDATKLFFTMMVSSFGLVSLISQSRKQHKYLSLSAWSNRERLIFLGVGGIGGILSGLVGSGIDIFTFSVMVLLFRICETVSTPTSVILMAFNAWVGFALHYFIIGDFVAPVTGYWLAAVPVVVIGAPVGALLCSLLKPKTIIYILLALISVELTSSLLLIPLNWELVLFCAVLLVVFSGLYYWMYRTKTYLLKEFLQEQNLHVDR